MPRWSTLLLVPVALAACARRGPVAASPSSPTVCIENAAAAAGAITAAAGMTRWHVLPGQTECKTIVGGSTSIVVQAQSIGGGAAGPLRYQTRIQTGPGCWYWRLENTPGPGSLWGCEQRRQQERDTARVG